MSFRMKDTSVYYLCESGEVRKRANSHRTTYIKLKTALVNAVEALGCKDASVDETMMRLRGVVFPGAVPAGWSKPDKHRLSRPLRLKENEAVRKHFTPDGGYMVERHPQLQEFFTWLGCPTGYRYTQGKTCSGNTCIGNIFAPVGVYWYAARGPLMLRTPDVAKEKADAASEKREVEKGALDWKPPKGLRRILAEEWALMQAKYERAHPEKRGEA